MYSVCMCLSVSGRKRGKMTENYIMYARAVQGAFTQQQAIHHCTDKISLLAGFKITNSIFNDLGNLVVKIHCKSIQSHRSYGTQSIQFSFIKTDCIHFGITSGRIQPLWFIHGYKENLIVSLHKHFMPCTNAFMAGVYVRSV